MNPAVLSWHEKNHPGNAFLAIMTFQEDKYITSSKNQISIPGKSGISGHVPPLASEIQKILGNFKTLYQLRMCMMTLSFRNFQV